MSAQPALRLVRDDDEQQPRLPALPRLASTDQPAGDLESQVEAMRREIESLTAELSGLRSKGETLNFHMSRLDEELRLAARLQQDFLPKTLPQVGRVHFHTLFRPAGYVSGDFYDVMRLDERNVGFYIADAVGHGVPAALLTMFIKHALATKKISPAGYRLLTASETMTRLNETLLDQQLSAATFATAIYGIINVETLRLTFSRGGHPHPFLLKANGEISALESEGGLLGIFPDETFTQQSVDLAPGDRLLLYTDGIEVLFASDLKSDHQRWRAELEGRRHLPAKEFLKDFADLIDGECQSARPKDDLTMVMLEVKA